MIGNEMLVKVFKREWEGVKGWWRYSKDSLEWVRRRGDKRKKVERKWREIWRKRKCWEAMGKVVGENRRKWKFIFEKMEKEGRQKMNGEREEKEGDRKEMKGAQERKCKEDGKKWKELGRK